MSQKLTHIIHCMYTGIPIGVLEIQTAVGHLPYLSHWTEMQAAHPFFSLPTGKLLAHARKEYERLAKASKDSESSAAEDKILQILFVAVLHTFGAVRQEAPALPEIEVVQELMPRLFKLAYWKHLLESKRFRYPEWKITQLNANTKFENIRYYIEACEDVRIDYERGVDDVIEKAKLLATEEALRKLRNQWLVPIGKRALWKWVFSYLASSQYGADATGWISTLFLGNEKTQLDFDPDETDLMQEMIESTCPGGNGIMKAVRDHIAAIRKNQVDIKEAFTVDFGALVEDSPLIQETEPKLEDFSSKVAWIKARAGWYLRQRKAGDL
jgi:hypothetical protein